MLRTTIAILALLSAHGCTDSENARCIPLLPNWIAPSGQKITEVAVKVELKKSQIVWNGMPIDEATLGNYLRSLSAKNIQPFLVFDPQTSDCRYGRRVRDLIDRNNPCQSGKCGQGHAEKFVDLVN